MWNVQLSKELNCWRYSMYCFRMARSTVKKSYAKPITFRLTMWPSKKSIVRLAVTTQILKTHGGRSEYGTELLYAHFQVTRIWELKSRSFLVVRKCIQRIAPRA